MALVESATTKLLMLIGGAVALSIGAAWNMDERFIDQLIAMDEHFTAGIERVEGGIWGHTEQVIRLQIQVEEVVEQAERHYGEDE